MSDIPTKIPNYYEELFRLKKNAELSIHKNNLLRFFSFIGLDDNKCTQMLILILELLDNSYDDITFYTNENKLIWRSRVKNSLLRSISYLIDYKTINSFNDGSIEVECILPLFVHIDKHNKELHIVLECLEQNYEEDMFLELEQKRIMELHSRQAQMGEMISMIAHQWRQPLSAISATSVNLRMGIELGEYDFEKKDDCKLFEADLVESLDDIDNYINTLTTTIDDFRTFYKPNKTIRHVSVNVPLEKALHIVRNAYESKGVKFIENYEATKSLSIYENEMMQVMLNIFKNAQDNFEEKNIKNSSIYISTYDTYTGSKIEISDNGGGIPDDILGKIFDPYFSTKNEKNGTGLGLYMSKTIVEEHHNGIIEAYNKNNGATFSIELNEEGSIRSISPFVLIYTSISTHLFSQEQINELLKESRRNNSKKGITGLLIYNKGSFLQILEGEESSVLDLFEKIKRDKRHKQISVMTSFVNDHRVFEKFPMGYAEVDQNDFKDIYAMKGFFSSDNWMFEADNVQIRYLLFAFENEKLRKKIK